MLIYDEVKNLSLRVPTIISDSQEIQLYDQDNLYPQRCEEAIKRSYTLRSIVNSIADFLNGEGFEDPNLANIKVNDEGLIGDTANKLLTRITKSVSRYDTIPLHINYDMNFRISSMVYVPFEFLRYGLPDETGKVETIRHSTNWEKNYRKDIKRKQVVTPYHIFNSDPDVISNQIDEAGGIEFYKGQMLYLTPDQYQYPVASFDPVLDHAETQSELGAFKLAYTKNGFMATLAILFPGEFETPEEKAQFKKLISDRSGARNANKRIGLQDKSNTRKIGDMFQSLQPANLDKLFELTEESAIRAITENEGWPKVLVGIQNKDALFTTDSMVEAYTYANSKTRNKRAYISEVFSYLFANWSKPLVTNATIREQQYVNNGTPTAPAPLPATQQKDGLPIPTQMEVNDNIKNLSPKQFQSVMRIRRMFHKPEGHINKIDQNMAIDLLMQALGIDENRAKIYLSIDSSEEEIVNLFIKLKQ